MDHISVPLTQICASLELLRRGVVDHEPCDPDEIDKAISALAEAHSQLGGETRRSLYELFASCGPDGKPEALARTVEALAQRLRHATSQPSAEQLNLFGPSDSTGDSGTSRYDRPSLARATGTLAAVGISIGADYSEASGPLTLPGVSGLPSSPADALVMYLWCRYGAYITPKCMRRQDESGT